jgi:hypothetical protein
MTDAARVDEKHAAQAEATRVSWIQLHKDKLWWFHSAYALLLGIGIMWLGARNYNFLRVTVLHVGFIWISSLFLPKLLNPSRLSPRWAPRLRLLINFFNKNLYQQVLFFILPIYYTSATLDSGNLVFVLLVAVSAILSTLDIVYDRHLSVRQSLTALFFAFNLFALINVMLPVLWSISNSWATRAAALLAAIGFLTLFKPVAPAPRLRRIAGVIAMALLVAMVEWGRPFIPPAPLHLLSPQFGADYEAESKILAPVLTKAEPGQGRQLHAVTPIKAPLGLKERVQHRWYKNGALVWASPFIEVTGGREQGFRLWTHHLFEVIEPGAELRVDVATEGGQLIGRAYLPVG